MRGPSRLVCSWFLLLTAAFAAGCAGGRPGPLDTPEAPTFDDVAATRAGRASASASNVARALGAQLGAHGLQPLTRSDRRYVIGRDTIAAAFLAGKDPLRDGSLIVVGVSEQGGAVALGAFSELARVMAHLARFYVVPEPTLVFVGLPTGREGAVLASLSRSPTWPADSVEAVVLIGGGDVGGEAVTIPVTGSAGATARAAYVMLRRLVYGHRARANASGSPAQSR